MAAQRFRGPVLPDGEARDLYVVDGAGHLRAAGRSPRRWPRAGSCPGWSTRTATSGSTRTAPSTRTTSEQQAITDRDAGALLLRDCGSAADTSWIHEREDLPRLIRAGRHIARTKRYIRNYAHEVEPDELPAYVAQEAQRGDGWVKLVGDWIERDAGDLAPVVPGGRLRRGDRGSPTSTAPRSPRTASARTVLPGPDRRGHRLHRARHRPVRRPDRRDGRARHRAGADRACSSNNFPDYADGGAARSSRRTPSTCCDLHARRRETIMAAYEAGVAIYAGTDAGGVLPHGLIAEEVAGARRPTASDARGRAGCGVLAGPRLARAGRAASPRAPPPTSWSSTATRSRT